jgi:hypothetical protein
MLLVYNKPIDRAGWDIDKDARNQPYMGRNRGWTHYCPWYWEFVGVVRSPSDDTAQPPDNLIK